MIIRLLMEHNSEIDPKTKKPRCAWVDIWGINPEEICLIRQSTLDAAAKDLLLKNFIRTEVLTKIPGTFAKFHFKDWELSFHGEHDTKEARERKRAAHSRAGAARVHSSVQPSPKGLPGVPTR